MREIVFDTETTGTSRDQDRLVEIGMVETDDKVPTGREYHVYINPGRPVHPEAAAVHGLTDAFLRDKQTFDEIVDDMLAFVAEAPMVAHNANFDRDFLNAELRRLNKAPFDNARFVDTLPMARKMFPGAKASLDALCKRFKIDSTRRTKHGALLDAQLLTEVYIALSGGRQRALGLASAAPAQTPVESRQAERAARANARGRKLLRAQASAAEKQRHRSFLETKIPNAIWFERDAADGDAGDQPSDGQIRPGQDKEAA